MIEVKNKLINKQANLLLINILLLQTLFIPYDANLR